MSFTELIFHTISANYSHTMNLFPHPYYFFVQDVEPTFKGVEPPFKDVERTFKDYERTFKDYERRLHKDILTLS